MKKVLFIDRDGTILREPPVTFQIDKLEQLEFLHGVIRNLYKIAQLHDYELVMVSNQDGMGTESFPREAFEEVQSKMLEILKGEGVEFSEVCIDCSLPGENKPTRKPGIGMLLKYTEGHYDLKNSFVIGDRKTDVQLAENLGCGSIFISNYESPGELGKNTSLLACNWDEIYEFLIPKRKALQLRQTKETNIRIAINLDGTGKSDISTGLAFFDHMLEQLSRHGMIDLELKAEGDLHIDEHHTIEDVGITLGEAFGKALGDKRGIERYGFCLPMDDCLAQVAVDFGGRSWIVWEAEFKREKIGEMPTEMFFHFFKSFSDAARCNLNIKADGINEHHKIEAIFKAFAKAIRMALKHDPGNKSLPSTKGLL
jgi:imidazoleglycerol-phosphate dehydratase/histidinol-phosphatase